MFILLGLSILLNFFPEKVGYYTSAADIQSFTPILAPDFSVQLPWLNLWWGIAFAMHLVNLLTKRWATATRWPDLLLGVMSIYVLGRILMGSPLFIYPIASLLAKLILGVVIVTQILRSVTKLQELSIGEDHLLRPEPVGK
jgi:hypothetical protein